MFPPKFYKTPLLLLLLFLALPAHAQGNCLLSKDALVPVMKHSAPGHKVGFGQGQKSIIETAATRDGTKVTYQVGGCNEFAFAYKFENIPGGVPANPGDPLSLPLKLMSSIPFRDQFDAEVLVKALKSSSGVKAQGKSPLNCGSATCNLTLGKDSVIIDYSHVIQ